MMRITEEQKMILSCYEGGKTKVIREMQAGIDELKSTGEDPEMLEMMEGLVQELKTCSNREYFQIRNGILFDNEEDEVEVAE